MSDSSEIDRAKYCEFDIPHILNVKTFWSPLTANYFDAQYSILTALTHRIYIEMYEMFRDG